MPERIVAASLLIVLGFLLTLYGRYDKRKTLSWNLIEAYKVYEVLTIFLAISLLAISLLAAVVIVITGPFWTN